MAKEKAKKNQENSTPSAKRSKGQTVGKVLLAIWNVVGGTVLLALKIIGTVLVLGVIAGLVFMSYLSTYLTDTVIPEAQDFAENLQLDSISLPQTSFIYYYDSVTGEYHEMQKLDTTQNRVWVSYQDIPEELVYSAVAIEDKRFFDHEGVDWITTGKACLNMFMGTGSAGGSTITQQLIKNLTGENEVTVHRKIQEVFRALEVEKLYSKEEIMEWYLNTIFLGEGCYGVQSAARVYFGKNVSDLTVAECASIISITNNPSLFDPYLRPERNRERQLIVLSQLCEQGYISETEYDQAKGQEMLFHSNFGEDEETYHCPECGFEGTRSQFEKNEEEERWYCPRCKSPTGIAPEQEYYSYFTDTVYRDVLSDLMEEYGYSEQVASQKLTTGGYKIYATIDMEVQRKVDQIYEDLTNVPETASSQQLQSAMVVVDNESGDIVAIAGGVGEKQGSLSWNYATQSRRQPGSSIKPITVYGPALDQGIITPATIYEDSPFDEESGWPLNDSRTYSGNVTVTKGVLSSLNTVAVKILDQLGVDQGFTYAQDKFGLSTLVESKVINGKNFTDRALAPLAMGALTYGVTVRDMSQAFAALANKGVYRDARTYTKVVDSTGKVILDNRQDRHVAISEKAAWYMTSMLKNAVNNGSSYFATIDGIDVAGKTGTSADDTDRWFAGYTPYYTAAVWCGYDEPEEIDLTGSGRNPSTTMWKLVMDLLHEGKESASFDAYGAYSRITICLDSGKLATSACEKVVEAKGKVSDRTASVVLLNEDLISGTCDMHKLMTVCSETGMVATEYCELMEAETEELGVVVKDEDGKTVKPETCTTHTKEAYQETQKPDPEDPIPDDPSQPGDHETKPTDPDNEPEPPDDGGDTGETHEPAP